MAGNGEFTLTVYAEPGKPFTFMGDAGILAVDMVTYTEDMLRKGILDGTLEAGAFDRFRCNSSAGPFVCDWPEWARGLKRIYQDHHRVNEEF